jgi:ADP-heptose:LPS heptosyltransferase
VEGNASPLSGRYYVKNNILYAYLRLVDATLSLVQTRERGTTPTFPGDGIKRILVANIAHLGDVVLSTTVLPVLKKAYPNAEIGFLAGSWGSVVASGHPMVKWLHVVDHWSFDRTRRSRLQKWLRYQQSFNSAVKEIQTIGYDLAIDLYWFFPNAIPLLWRARIPRRVGYVSGGFGPLLTLAKEWQNSDQSVAEYHLDLLRFIGIPEQLLRLGAPNLPLNYNLGSQATPFQKTSNCSYIVMHPGSGAPFREWPLNHWRTLAARLVAAGFNLVFTGSGEIEAHRTQSIVDGLPRCTNVCNKLDWHAFVEVVRNGALLVGVESVAMHVATAVNTPCVAIMSGVAPHHWAPRSITSHPIMSKVACSPCYKSGGCQRMSCVRELAPEAVYKVVTELAGDTN